MNRLTEMYVRLVNSGKMRIDEVPEKYREEVRKHIK